MRAALGLIAVLLAVAAVLVSASVRNMPGVAAADEVVQDCVYAIAALLVFGRAAAVRHARPAWLLLAAGLTAYGVANVYYFAVVQNLDPEPFPSRSDAGWLLFYPLAYACLALLVRGQVHRWHASLWLDGLVAACGLAAVAIAAVFHFVLAPGEGARDAVLVALAYPVADLLLIVLLAGAFAVLGWRVGLRWGLLATGLLWFSGGDVWFLLQSAPARGTLRAPGWTSPGWWGWR